MMLHLPKSVSRTLFRSSRLVYILRPKRSRGGVVRCFREKLARTFCAASGVAFK